VPAGHRFSPIAVRRGVSHRVYTVHDGYLNAGIMNIVGAKSKILQSGTLSHKPERKPVSINQMNKAIELKDK
jgi:hypothetical protein